MIMVLVLVVATALGLATALVLATVKDLLTALVLATVKDLAMVLVQAPRVVMVLGLFTVVLVLAPVLDMVLVPKSAMVLVPSLAMDQLATVLRPLEAMVNHLAATVV